MTDNRAFLYPVAINIRMTRAQYDTYHAFAKQYGTDVYLQRGGEHFAIHVDHHRYEFMGHYVVSEDGWTEEPFDDWDVDWENSSFIRDTNNYRVRGKNLEEIL